MTNSVASLLPCLHPRRGAATTTDREDQVILENTRAAVSVRIDVRGCPFRGLVPLNSTPVSSTMRFWGDCVSLCTVILHAYIKECMSWAFSKLDLLHTQIRGTTTGLAEKRPNRRAKFAVGVVSRKREGRLWCRGRRI